MSYTVHQSGLNESRETILTFWRSHHTRALDAKFHWMYQSNPAGVAHVWLVHHDQSGEVAGMISLFPRRFIVGGVEKRGGIVGDFLVAPHHRSLGPALMLLKSVIDGVNAGMVDFAYGVPNTAAYPVMKRAGFHTLGSTVKMAKVLSCRDLLARRVARPLCCIAAPPLDAILRLLSFDTWTCGRHGLKVAQSREFTTGIQKTLPSSSHAFSVQVVRDQTYAVWKYTLDPDDIHTIFTAQQDGNQEMSGYGVVRTDEHTIEIRDIHPFEIPHRTGILLAAMIRHARRMRARSIHCTLLNNSRAVRILADRGFLQASQGFKVVCHVPPTADPGLRTTLMNAENWLFLNSDVDT